MKMALTRSEMARRAGLPEERPTKNAGPAPDPLAAPAPGDRAIFCTARSGATNAERRAADTGKRGAFRIDAPRPPFSNMRYGNECAKAGDPDAVGEDQHPGRRIERRGALPSEKRATAVRRWKGKLMGTV